MKVTPATRLMLLPSGGHYCFKCNGSGVEGMLSAQRVCSTCRGSGAMQGILSPALNLSPAKSTPCYTCNGTGYVGT